MSIVTPLVIEKTPKTPQVTFDPTSNFFEISGRSLPENVIKTYEPILQWIDENVGKIQGSSVFNFRIDYLNSASTKMISLILIRLEEFFKSGSNIEVNWFYNVDDYDIQSEGEIYAKLRKIPINLISFEDDE